MMHGGATLKLPLFTALRESLAEGYTRRMLRGDLVAGITVGIIAIPLAMALAIAVGVEPQQGLYTAIIAGLVIAVAGGSRFNVSGPTAAFVVILLPITQAHGPAGLLMVTMMAGIILMLAGMARLGNLVQFVPYPVIIGFTAGIAIVIATLQVKDLLGLSMPTAEAGYIDQLAALGAALPTWRAGDSLVGALTLAILILWPKLTRRIPSHLVALLVGSLAAIALGLAAIPVETLGSRFSYTLDGVTYPGIPAVVPQLMLPWTLPGPDGVPLLPTLALIRELFPAALAVAMLGAIESLLCALVADGMSGTRHDPNAELTGQGLGNLIAPLFGGITATAALARTAANVRAGAFTPIAAVIHALVVLAAVVLLAELFAYLPMASLAALLLMVAWHMSEAPRVLHLLRIGPRGDIAVLLTCLSLTVIFDMVLAVGVGLLLAAALFLRRMAEVSQGSDQPRALHPALAELPASVALYQVRGPLFFAAADKALSAMSRYDAETSVLALDLSEVPSMDMSALILLEKGLQDLARRSIRVCLIGANASLRQQLSRAGVGARRGQRAFAANPEAAARLIRRMLGDSALSVP